MRNLSLTQKLGKKGGFSKVSFFVAVVLLMLFCPKEAVSADSFHRVRWVNDGDTVILDDNRRIRYIGINSPEVAHKDSPAERFGIEARDFNKKLVNKKKVRLEFDREKQDQYGRTLAYLYLQDNTFVNAEMVKSGHAFYVFRRPNTKHNSLLLRLQQEAMAKKKGMWERFQNEKGPFLGNRNSMRFHKPTCAFGKATSAKNRITFNNQFDAFWAGYSPCKKCNFN